MVRNLNQLKKALTVGAKIEVVKQFFHPIHEGEIREVTKVQTNAIYMKPIRRVDGPLDEAGEKLAQANGGVGSYMPFGKSECWVFNEDGTIYYRDFFDTYENGEKIRKESPIAVYRLVEG